MAAHATLSPSGAHRWMNCPGSVLLESQCPERGSSSFADEGTAAHFLASEALTGGHDAAHYIGQRIVVSRKFPTAWLPDGWVAGNYSTDFAVDHGMAGFVQTYLDYVRALQGTRYIELALDISTITGEKGARGTADAVILADEELVIVDLKFGQGLRVNADSNEQLMTYALAALDDFGLVQDFSQARLAIVQPRLNHISEWVVSVADLRAFGARAGRAARLCLDILDTGHAGAEDFIPGDKPCRFCAAKASCPALATHVLNTVADDFVDLTQPVAPQLEASATRTTDNATLGNLRGAVDLIEGWCKAICARAESELLAGHAVPGWKLVEGRRGARRWADPEEAEAALKAMKVKHDQMYNYSVISPTSAERLAKAEVIGPRQWPKLQALITQPDGKPSVAPASDARPALAIPPTADDFSDETLTDLV